MVGEPLHINDSMGRIAKKPRSVKGKKEHKEVKSPPRYTIRKDSLGRRYAIEKRTGQRVSVYKAEKEHKEVKSPPRYTIRKDSLGRRYAIEKRTGQRVSVYKAEKERIKRAAARKAIAAPKKTSKPKQIFRGITPPKAVKRRKTSKKRCSEAAKKGWETRRRREGPPPSAPILFEGRPPSFGELIGPYIPEGMKMHVAGGVADRAAMYPKVAVAADFSWINLQVEAFARQRALSEGQKPTPINTPRFDRIYGQGHGEFVRGIYARATNLQDIDQMVDTLENDEDYDYSSRELYTLYFSPEVA